MTSVRWAVLLILVSVGAAIGSAGQENATPVLKPMARDADPSFEVAVIKPSDPDDRNNGFRLDGHRIRVEATSLNSIVCFAYSVQRTQIVNAPSWFDERWDIDGVPDVEGKPNWDQYRHMLQKLLATRFRVKLRQDKRELPVYALRVTKGGPKLKESTSDQDALSDSSGNGRGAAQYMKFTNVTMKGFGQVMGLMVDRPVVDQTNLPGRYDFELLWTPDTVRAAPTDAAPGLFTAVQEQLGLKLSAERLPADVLVIDAATRPTQN